MISPLDMLENRGKYYIAFHDTTFYLHAEKSNVLFPHYLPGTLLMYRFSAFSLHFINTEGLEGK